MIRNGTEFLEESYRQYQIVTTRELNRNHPKPPSRELMVPNLISKDQWYLLSNAFRFYLGFYERWRLRYPTLEKLRDASYRRVIREGGKAGRDMAQKLLNQDLPIVEQALLEGRYQDTLDQARCEDWGKINIPIAFADEGKNGVLVSVLKREEVGLAALRARDFY